MQKNLLNSAYAIKVDYSWDYRGEKTKSYTHGIHTYPAMFIPQVANRILKTYSWPGDTVCDIFCGSGTALVESKVLGRNAYGIDLNPLAVFLAKAKTKPINPAKLRSEYSKLLSAIDNTKDGEIKKPEFKNIDFWFKEEAIVALAKIKEGLSRIKDKDVRNFLTASFSETVRLSSNTKSGEFKLVRIKEGKLKNYSPDVMGIFRKKTEANIKGMEDFHKAADSKVWTNVIYGNSAEDNGISKSSVDLILTSPPYGDSRTTVAYGQFSRLSAQWTDIFEDPNKASGVDKELLGGKANRTLEHNLKSYYLDDSLNRIAGRDEKRAKEVLSFYVGLNECLKQAYRMLKPNKYFCLVIGNRLVKQVRISTDLIIAELGEEIGFICEDIFIRNIPGKRMPLKNSPTNIAGVLEETMVKESIVILRKVS